MHVIIYWPNFAPPHFAAHGIPKNTPHGTMEGHTAYIYVVCLPLPDGAFSFFSIHKAHTWKISASCTLLREARDVHAIISTSTEPSGTD